MSYNQDETRLVNCVCIKPQKQEPITSQLEVKAELKVVLVAEAALPQAAQTGELRRIQRVTHRQK